MTKFKWNISFETWRATICSSLFEFWLVTLLNCFRLPDMKWIFFPLSDRCVLVENRPEWMDKEISVTDTFPNNKYNETILNVTRISDTIVLTNISYCVFRKWEHHSHSAQVCTILGINKFWEANKQSKEKTRGFSSKLELSAKWSSKKWPNRSISSSTFDDIIWSIRLWMRIDCH